MKRHMLFLGFGYAAEALARRLDRRQWRLTGTFRSPPGREAMLAQDVEATAFHSLTAIPAGVTHLVCSIPPDEKGDPCVRQAFAACPPGNLSWLAYLSTTGVYGDHRGGWVDESTPPTPNTERGARRVAAEREWLDVHRRCGAPVHVFRLAGIYGPGRNVLDNLRAGTARRINKPGQVFSRIHVDDIAGVLLASLARPRPGAIYNVADDHPCPPQDVVCHGAELLGLKPPEEVSLEEAGLTAMARSFYEDSKRVSNACIKRELGYRLRYPTYREGLRALL